MTAMLAVLHEFSRDTAKEVLNVAEVVEPSLKATNQLGKVTTPGRAVFALPSRNNELSPVSAGRGKASAWTTS